MITTQERLATMVPWNIVVQLMNGIQDAVVVTDDSGNICCINPAAREMFGYEETEVIDLSLSVIDVIGTPAKLLTNSAIDNNDTGTINKPTAGIRKDGTVFPVRVRVSPFTAPDERCSGFIVVYMNNPQVPNLSEALGQEQTGSTRRQEMKSVSHELRTPLTAIAGFAELLAGMENMPSAGIEFVSAIQASAQRLSTHIDSIIDYAAAQVGCANVRLEPYDLQPSLTAMTASVAERLKSRSVGWDLTFDDRLPKDVYLDAVHFERVIGILLDNAEKFTESGTVRMSVSIPSNKSDWLCVAVSDTGAGYDQRVAALMFEPFRQADDGLNRRYCGIGLGLTLGREIAQLLGGTLESTSVVGEGSTFTLTIPTRSSAAS
jgi:PAS domain S-box-containing protein